MAETPKTETVLRVECYAGFKGDERPVRFVLAGRTFEVAEVEDKWYSPGTTFFRVLTTNEDRFLLRHEDAQDVWSLEGYCAARQEGEQAVKPLDLDDSGPVN